MKKIKITRESVQAVQARIEQYDVCIASNDYDGMEMYRYNLAMSNRWLEADFEREGATIKLTDEEADLLIDELKEMIYDIAVELASNTTVEDKRFADANIDRSELSEYMQSVGLADYDIEKDMEESEFESRLKRLTDVVTSAMILESDND